MKSVLQSANSNSMVGRGRPALTGQNLYVPGLRSIIENKPVTHYYKKKLAEKGFIGLIAHKAAGSRGRPELKPVLTTKGLRYFEKHQKKVPGYLTTEEAATAPNAA